MLYKKNKSARLDDALFKNPTAEYRGAPFWSWNTKLVKDELMEQYECLKQMGFGGAHIHARTGLDTPYLGEEFMDCVKTVVDRSKRDGQIAYLYDEDRWPSGAAGGLVTKELKYRQQYLLFTPSKQEDEHVVELTGIYDIVQDSEGKLLSYGMISKPEEAKGSVWYAYIKRAAPCSWHNNQTYVDTLNKEAIDKFIDITYEAYKKAVGEEFGTVVPSIFTDEPQFSRKATFCFPNEKRDITLPWTKDLIKTFNDTYGEDLAAGIPELFWERADGEVSTIRYHYHDHITERFTAAFADNCGRWCRENGIMLTGHMMEEPTLLSQTAALGEAMRAYRGFELPGIDMLNNSYEYSTAKQAQSASHQYGREGVMSELYGVTSWNFDFRMHKLQGDWQAALGVTLRVPHLSWVSMKGESKRDYPASINYQAPWHREYKLVEDHFARVNTAMTRGKAKVRVGVVHPVESYWLHWGPSSQTSLEREQLEDNFRNVTEWLLFGGIDFDYIDESLLPSLCEKASNPLKVGEMEYDAVIVPGCETLRGTTFERLSDFAKQGGHLIIMGDAPVYKDAVKSPAGAELASLAENITFSRSALMKAVEKQRIISMKHTDGVMTGHLIYQLREDNDCEWLFIAHGRPVHPKDVVWRDAVRIGIKGSFSVTEYNTVTGEIKPIGAAYENGETVIYREIMNQDSLLLKLVPADAPAAAASVKTEQANRVQISVPHKVPVTLSEPNALMLDSGEFALDDEEYRPRTELLRAGNIVRDMLGYPYRDGGIAQPWTMKKEKPEHKVRMRFKVMSEIECDNISLALEDAETACINWNGSHIPSDINGYYVDHCIKTVKLGRLLKGENILEIVVPFGRNTDIEWCYLLGDFGVRAEGDRAVVTQPVRELCFGDSAVQGLPFYGGNITYHIKAGLEHGKNTVIHIPRYRGALMSFETSGERKGTIAFAPYDLSFKADSQQIDVTLFGSRINTFGAVHMIDEGSRNLHPGCWRTNGDGWTDEYYLDQTGILSKPVIWQEEE